MADFFDIAVVAENIETRNREIHKEAQIRRRRPQEEGKTIAHKLKIAMPEIKAVWGFGSTYEENRPYHLNSDIDLAIEGGDILQAFLIAEKSEFKVDIVEIFAEDDTFSKMLKQNGKRLL